MSNPVASAKHTVDRRILALAVPAFGALVAEPLFLLVDSAMIGHLGADSLAGVAIAATIMQTLVGLMVFLAYATTPLTARRLGAGDRAGAIRDGSAGLWLAAGIGAVLLAVCLPLTKTVVSLFPITDSVAHNATTYLSISLFGLPAMLGVYGATGLLRGLQDTITPLLVSVFGFAANAAMNYLLIFPAGMGVAGSALGTVIAQWAMLATYLLVIATLARRVGASLRPRRAALKEGAISGGWLLCRTVSLRGALLLTLAAASALGTAELAGYQVMAVVFNTAVFALDSLAIAAQALIGYASGTGTGTARQVVRTVLKRCVIWGLGIGVVLGTLLCVISPVLGRLFTSDASVLSILPVTLVIVGVSLPLSSYVFVLDGVLMGASDARYLAVAGVFALGGYAAIVAAVWSWSPSGAAGLAAISASYTLGYMALRALTLGLRVRTEAWLPKESTR